MSIKKLCRYEKKIEHVFKDYCVLRELGYDFETDSLRKGTENGRK